MPRSRPQSGFHSQRILLRHSQSPLRAAVSPRNRAQSHLVRYTTLELLVDRSWRFLLILFLFPISSILSFSKQYSTYCSHEGCMNNLETLRQGRSAPLPECLQVVHTPYPPCF